MKTYAIAYRFEATDAAQEFRDSLANTFRDIREEHTDRFHFIGFTGGKEPEIEDKLSGIIRNIGHHSTLGNGDYVAVYFSAAHDENEITRQMAFGKDEFVDNHVKPGNRPEHTNIITNLLDYDPVRHKSL